MIITKELTKQEFDEKWSKIMSITCLALQSIKILSMVNSFGRRQSLCKPVILSPVDKTPCVHTTVPGDAIMLWRTVQIMLLAS